ncbi:MAG: stage III sporulation protein AB [Clostridiales bacterium]|nr:stage III sporulation protein AB [Clostridiales bacterium]
MVKAAGAVCVLLGCLLPVCHRLRLEREHIAQLGALAQALDGMRRQLTICAPPMEELLAYAGRTPEGTVRRFFTALRLEELEQRPFVALWDGAIRSSGLALNREERETLSQVGQVLGTCGVEEQCDRLADAADTLRCYQTRRREALRGERRLWYTLAASAGLLVVLILF